MATPDPYPEPEPVTAASTRGRGHIVPAPPGHPKFVAAAEDEMMLEFGSRNDMDFDDGRRFMVGDRVGVCAGGSSWGHDPPHPFHADYVRIQYHHHFFGERRGDFDVWFAREYPELKKLVDELRAEDRASRGIHGPPTSRELVKQREFVTSVAYATHHRVSMLKPGTKFHVASCGDDGYRIELIDDLEVYTV